MSFSGRRSPGVTLEFAPGRNFRQSAGHAIRFKRQLLTQPAPWRDAADREFDERAWQERFTITHVEGTARVGLNLQPRADRRLGSGWLSHNRCQPCIDILAAAGLTAVDCQDVLSGIQDSLGGRIDWHEIVITG